MKIRQLLLSIILIIPLFACSETSEPLTKTITALDTANSITLYDKKDEKLIDHCFKLLNKYELIFSTTNSNSELYKINNSNETSFTISDDLKTLINEGIKMHQINNKFDITIQKVSKLWDFKEGTTLPNQDDINNNLQYVDSNKIRIEGNTLYKDVNIEISLGSIAKGYISDKLKDYLVKQGVKSAVINLGGNILTIGKKDDSNFNIGIQEPFSNEIIKSVSINDQSVVTSGIYQRYFKLDDKIYHHILDPDTGYPIDNDIVSISIITNSGLEGDKLSTLCFLLGKDKAIEYINTLKNTECIIIDKNNKLYYSKNAKKYLKK